MKNRKCVNATEAIMYREETKTRRKGNIKRELENSGGAAGLAHIIYESHHIERDGRRGGSDQ